MASADGSGQRKMHLGIGARWGRALRRRRNWMDLGRYCVVGALGYVVNLAVYVALVHGLGVYYVLAAAGSFSVAVVNNYVWNRRWTFGRRRARLVRQGTRFLLVSVVALGANLILLRTAVASGLPKVVAQAVAIALVTPVSFVGNRVWSFAAEKPPDAVSRRLAWVLSGCATTLGAMVAVWCFVLSQTPARLAKPSAALIHRLDLWSAVTNADLPVPTTRPGIAAAVLLTTALAFAVYAAALRACWRREATPRRLALVAGGALVFFALTVVALPTLNTDIYEYMATGRVAAVHGADPYAVAADAFPGDPAYAYTDRRYTSIPGDNKLGVWTLLDVGLAKVTGRQVVDGLVAYRVALALCGALSLLLIVLLLRRLYPRAQLAGVVAYGWNPIVIMGAPTKVDSVMVALVLAGALALVAGHRRVGAVGMVLSALVKLVTLPLVAVRWVGLLRRHRWAELALEAALVAVTVAVVYAPFAGAPGLMGRELRLLQTGGSSPPRAVVALIFALVMLAVGLRQDGTPRRMVRGWAVVSVAFAALLPDLGFSWYLLVPIAMTALAASAPLVAAMTAIGVLSFSSDLWSTVGHGPFPRDVLTIAAAGVAITLAAVLAGRALHRRRAPAPVARARPSQAWGVPWLVLPTYDEADNLETVIEGARAALSCAAPEGFVILVVDDDSPDGTGWIADRLAAEHAEVRVLHRTVREGLGPAYLAGFAQALDEGAGFVFEMDADGSHDPADLVRLLSAVRDEGADVALGSRYVAGGGVSDWGRIRRGISRGGSWYARQVLGLPVRDLTGGFKCLRREVLERIDLPSVRARGYAFQVELTYRAVREGFAVAEVPIVFRDRRLGRSKMSVTIALEALWLIPAIRMSSTDDAATAHTAFEDRPGAEPGLIPLGSPSVPPP
ncbi:glycosyltransferase [Baekduia soli]|uniref:Glycosyltransferase n=1 Tax=Baekduia soli TaxID=496014 RepID=A0A5B8U9M0_9ACTN|nr:GtrA family protein [Baekduia soli]QEC49869.1 glycosyltransferase [Baekduia soli]